MKKLLCLAAVGALCATMTYGDIGVKWLSSAGFYGNPGSWAAGPYPDSLGLRQLLWSPNDPSAYTVNSSGFAVGQTEFLLATYAPGGGSDYGQWNEGQTSSPILRNNANVGGANINNGYLYSRVFIDPVPDANDYYYQSPAAGPSLTVYDPFNIATLITHDSSFTALGEPVQLNRQVVPEPSVLAFFAIGSAVAAVRRMRKQA
jgi:hypothetical protein